jgi:hypothetical protein
VKIQQNHPHHKIAIAAIETVLGSVGGEKKFRLLKVIRIAVI